MTKAETKVYFFFNNNSSESLHTKFILSSVLAQNSRLLKIEYKEININEYPLMCDEYNIKRLPTTLIIQNDKIIDQISGELKVGQVISIIKDIKYNLIKYKRETK